MHELSVAMSIIESVEEEAERHEGRVIGIHLKLGPLAGVMRDALLSAFDLAREGTPLAGTRLIIEDVPIVVYCPKCRKQQPVTSMQWFCCSVCDTPVSEIVQGKELEIVALEMNVDGQ
jgi:hydrogenase nickel incorporation protein HypA/HybF